MSGNDNKEYPIVTASFCLSTCDRDVDLSYINALLGMTGKSKRKSEFVPSAKEFSHSYWCIALERDRVVSLEDVIQELLDPLCENLDTIHKLLESEKLCSSVVVSIIYDDEEFLPMLVLGSKTIDMMNALRVSEFSIDPYYESNSYDERFMRFGVQH